MIRNVLKYEIKRASLPFMALYGIVFAFAIMARMKIFSLTDMPLFYIAFFGATTILLFRYWNTMFGQEATFLFSIPLKAGTQVGIRLSLAAFFSAITALIIALAILLQGEAMGILIAELTFVTALIIFIEISISMFYLIIQLEAALTLANLPFCRNKRKLWVLIWVVIIFGATSILTSITSNFIKQYIVISEAGKIFLDTTNITPLSFSFSLNTAMWMIIILPFLVWLIIYVTKHYLSIT